MKKIIFSKLSSRKIQKFEKNLQERIFQKLHFYSRCSNPLEFAKPLKNSKYGNWRFQIGDYRVLFDINGDKIIILKIGHRKDIYK